MLETPRKQPSLVSVSSMDRNTKCCQRYAKMSHDKKDDLLHCHREANAAKKHKMSSAASDSAAQGRTCKRKHASHVCKTPLGHIETGVSVPGGSNQDCYAEHPEVVSGQHLESRLSYFPEHRTAIDSDELERLLDSVCNELESTRRLASSSVSPVNIIPSDSQGESTYFITFDKSQPYTSRTLKHVMVSTKPSAGGWPKFSYVDISQNAFVIKQTVYYLTPSEADFKINWITRQIENISGSLYCNRFFLE